MNTREKIAAAFGEIPKITAFLILVFLLTLTGTILFPAQASVFLVVLGAAVVFAFIIRVLSYGYVGPTNGRPEPPKH